ncbi:Hypothetical predicted protein, partial [Paramuricea clavata]
EASNHGDSIFDLDDTTLDTSVKGKLDQINQILVNTTIGETGQATGLTITADAAILLKSLTKGLVITKDGKILGNKGLNIAKFAIINGNIENDGVIDGGVKIGTANNAFPLRSPTANASVTSFTNTGTVSGGFAIAGKQQVKGTPANSNGVDTFKLINKSGGVITGDIALSSTSTDIKFNLENDAGGKISGGAITVTKIDNKGVISPSASGKTITADEIINNGIIATGKKED